MYYASLFNSVEINSTFYQLPKSSTVAKWAESVPDDFKFSFKVPKTITHSKKLGFEPKEINKFLDVVEYCGEKKGCLLVQLPPFLHLKDQDRLTLLFEILREHKNPWKIAVEFRNMSWYNPNVFELLNTYDISLVIHDMASSETPKLDLASDFIYLRFHGPEPSYRGDYHVEFLEQQAKIIKDGLQQRKTVFVYFNNTVGQAFYNLQRLNTLVEK